MKKFIKEWIFPPKVLDLISSQISIYKTRKLDLSVLKKNIELKDIYKGKRCFILGHGPSIKDIDITILKNEIVFVMSTFYNHPDFNLLNHTFHSCVKIPNVFNSKDKYEILKDLSDHVLSDSIILLDLNDKRIIDKYNLFPKNKIYYIATSNINRGFNLLKITKNNRTNPLHTLEYALYMGFTEIYLHGLDHDEACKQNYQYGFENKLAIKDPNNDNNGISIRKQSDIFYNASLTYKEFEDMSDYAKEKGVNIVNLNQKGQLNMFVREDIANLSFEKK